MNPELIAAGTSAIGSLIGNLMGGGAQRQANRLKQTGLGYLNDAGSLLPGYHNFTNTAQSQYNQFAPQETQAIQDEANYYKQDPYTDNYSTQQMAKATAGGTNAYLASRANILADASRRGVSAPGATSAGVEGGLASASNAQAGQQAAAANQLAYQKIVDKERRMQALRSLLGGATSNAFNTGMGAMGAEGNLDASLYGAYSGAAQQEQARANATGAGIGQLSGGLGSLASILSQGNPAATDWGATPTVSMKVPRVYAGGGNAGQATTYSPY